MVTVTKELNFCAAHRLLGYHGACSNIHGHNYKVEIEIGRPSLNDQYMVCDFKVIKEQFQKWLDDNWDHAILLNSGDKVIIEALGNSGDAFKWWMFPKVNPTAEEMCQILFMQFSTMLPAGLSLERITVWETPTSYAEVRP